MAITAAINKTDRPWVTAGSVILAASGGLIALFWSDAQGVVRVWVESTAYNHCFLVVPLAGYLIWERREVLRSTVPAPQLRWLATVPALSAMWLVAAALGVHEAEQLIVASMLQAILLSILGWDAYRRLLAPLLYLYFLVSAGEFLVPLLQRLTAEMSVQGLRLVGVPVFSDGVFIEVPAGRFVVAEECAGLRFLIASVAFGVFFAVITYRSSLRRAAFIALSVAVPIVANGVRAFGIIYAAEIVGSASAVMADHVIYGWGFFSAILVLLVLVGRRFADRQHPAIIRPFTARPPFATHRCVLVGLLGVALAGVGPAYASVLDDQSAAGMIGDVAEPRVGAPWRQLPGGPTDNWSPVVYGADHVIHDALTDGGGTVYRFVALYLSHGRENNLIRSENRIVDGARWRIALEETATIDISGQPQRVNVSEIVSGDRSRLVVWFYVVDGVATASAFSAKLHQLRGFLSTRRQLSALVAIAVDIHDRADAPLATAARFLSAMGTFPDQLRARSEQ